MARNQQVSSSSRHHSAKHQQLVSSCAIAYKVHQDDLTGPNYPLVKEYLLELGVDSPSAADFQAL